MTPSQTPEAAGLEVVAWRKNVWVADGIGTGWMLSNDQPEPHHLPTDIEPLVTAASAQARIDEERALFKSLRVRKNFYKENMLAAEDRATAAEARADRLAQALREIAELCPATCEMTTAHDMAWIAIEALQQETQP